MKPGRLKSSRIPPKPLYYPYISSASDTTSSRNINFKCKANLLSYPRMEKKKKQRTKKRLLFTPFLSWCNLFTLQREYYYSAVCIIVLLITLCPTDSCPSMEENKKKENDYCLLLSSHSVTLLTLRRE